MQDRKYRLFWAIGTALSFLLYFCGILWVYVIMRRKIVKRRRCSVLTYHRVRDDGKDAHISVSPGKFKKQMEYLADNLDIVPLSKIVDYADGKGAGTGKDMAAITFDDGYEDNFSAAYGILQAYSLPATIFLVSGRIGKDRDMLDEEKINIMKNNGIDFGSHTVTHPVLSEVGLSAAQKEIRDSKVRLERVTNSRIDYFAYPKGKRGHFNKDIEDSVKDAGYRAAFTTENGDIFAGDNLFAIKRIGIRDCPLFVFKVRVSGIFESRPFSFMRNVLGLN